MSTLVEALSLDCRLSSLGLALSLGKTYQYYWGKRLHYKTNSRIISRIIRLELVVDYQPDYQVNYQPDYQPGSTEVPAW